MEGVWTSRRRRRGRKQSAWVLSWRMWSSCCSRILASTRCSVADSWSLVGNLPSLGCSRQPQTFHLGSAGMPLPPSTCFSTTCPASSGPSPMSAFSSSSPTFSTRDLWIRLLTRWSASSSPLSEWSKTLSVRCSTSEPSLLAKRSSPPHGALCFAIAALLSYTASSSGSSRKTPSWSCLARRLSRPTLSIGQLVGMSIRCRFTRSRTACSPRPPQCCGPWPYSPARSCRQTMLEWRCSTPRRQYVSI
mmetsp:Transcript_112908/g.224735  ORF Transcript_112908/g.224735 Transcript_112908/m.224735 type:complete len:247 (+) Transcript_112908:1341-2081(+)